MRPASIGAMRTEATGVWNVHSAPPLPARARARSDENPNFISEIVVTTEGRASAFAKDDASAETTAGGKLPALRPLEYAGALSKIKEKKTDPGVADGDGVSAGRRDGYAVIDSTADAVAVGVNETPGLCVKLTAPLSDAEGVSVIWEVTLALAVGEDASDGMVAAADADASPVAAALDDADVESDIESLGAAEGEFDASAVNVAVTAAVALADTDANAVRVIAATDAVACSVVNGDIVCAMTVADAQLLAIGDALIEREELTVCDAAVVGVAAADMNDAVDIPDADAAIVIDPLDIGDAESAPVRVGVAKAEKVVTDCVAAADADELTDTLSV